MPKIPHVLTEPQLKCLTSAPRQRVYEAIRSREGASATDVGMVLGMSSESVIFHLKQLQKVDLIVAVGSRPTGRRPSCTFAAVHERVVIDRNSSSYDNVRRTTAATIRESHRQFLASSDFAEQDTITRDSLLILRTQFRLNPETQAKVKQLILEAVEFAKKNQSPDGQMMGFLNLYYPIAPK
jgi:predicted ArsR family transcriptional regulator